MSYCQVTLSANAGVALHLGSMRVWSDALHDQRVAGFSSVTPERWTILQAHPDFSSPDLLFYTHCHPDHYSRNLTEQVIARHPQIPLVMPQQDFDRQLVLSAPAAHLALEGLRMDFTLPAQSGEGHPLSGRELQDLLVRESPSVFFSQDLCARYFTYARDGETHFVLFDDADTLSQKLRTGGNMGFAAAFLMYPEVQDLLPRLFPGRRT